MKGNLAVQILVAFVLGYVVTRLVLSLILLIT